MSKKVIAIISVVAVLIIAAAVGLFLFFRTGGPYSGKVTEADTGNPVSGVMVTDGRNVVKTDENGQFTLKGYRKTRFITITTPSGYTCENFYISASKDTEKYNFALTKDERTAAEDHSFIQISDTEIGENGVGDWLNYVKKAVADEKPAFLIHTGDICYEAGLKRHKSDMNSENMGLPVYYTIGNHDYVEGKYGEELYESIYGPTWYSFNVGNVHYVVTPFIGWADYKSGYNDKDKWKWLENDLANIDPDMKVVIFNHTKSPSEDYVISFSGKDLDLKKHNLIAWVYGHYHNNHVEMQNGVLSVSTARPDCGGIDQSVSGARLINVNAAGEISTSMIYYDYDVTKTPEAEKAVWTQQMSGNVVFSDPLYYDGKVYAATSYDDYPAKCGIYCMDEKTGKQLWFTETKNSVKSKLVMENGKIYTQSAEGYVYCINPADGKVIWEKQVPVGNGLNTCSGICADNGVIYAGNSSYVTALNGETGEMVWENNRGKGETSPAEFVVAGDKLIVSSHWDALVALDKNTGKQLWENKDEDIRFRSSTPAVVDENTLIVADDDAIMLVDLATGNITNKTTMEGYNLSSSAKPLVSGDMAYIPTATKGVLAYSLIEKKVKWELPVGKALVYTAPYTSGDSQTVESDIVEKDGKLIFAASDGYVYVADKSGKILEKINIGSPILSTPIVLEDALVVADFSGRLVKVQF